MGGSYHGIQLFLFLVTALAEHLYYHLHLFNLVLPAKLNPIYDKIEIFGWLCAFILSCSLCFKPILLLNFYQFFRQDYDAS